MIVYIKGKIITKESDRVVINVSGIGYECNISFYTYENLPETGSEVSLNTFLQITENSHSLYAFIDLEEKSLFKMLISINGIGPKTVMPILSSARPDDIINRIISGDVSMLSSLPGIGTKTAKRIIVELKDKLSNYSSDQIPESEDNNIIKDSLNALASLGYTGVSIKREINKILAEEPEIEIEDLIKKTLSTIK